MSGGIIIQRASILIPAVNDPSFLQYLDPSDQERCQTIAAKGAGGCDEGDVRYMAHMLEHVATHS